MNQKLSQDIEDTDNPGLGCNICFDKPKGPVAGLCGHLFCWACLYEWFKQNKPCPVCNAAISKDKIIPIYGHGDDEKDPRDNIPPRPLGQWTKAPDRPNANVWPQTGAPMFGFGDGGFHMSFAFGTLPQYFMTWAQELTQPQTTDQVSDPDFFFAKIFAICGALLIYIFQVYAG